MYIGYKLHKWGCCSVLQGIACFAIDPRCERQATATATIGLRMVRKAFASLTVHCRSVRHAIARFTMRLRCLRRHFATVDMGCAVCGSGEQNLKYLKITDKLFRTLNFMMLVVR
jgi:hypothetical protein